MPFSDDLHLPHIQQEDDKPSYLELPHEPGLPVPDVAGNPNVGDAGADLGVPPGVDLPVEVQSPPGLDLDFTAGGSPHCAIHTRSSSSTTAWIERSSAEISI